jgi:ribonuclease HI
MSTCPLDTCPDCIKWDDKAEMLINDGRKLMIVFTDGSANAINTDNLAYGGWGFFLHRGSNQNKGGALVGKPTTSYRAEVRAVLEVIWRTKEPTCIVTDCKSVNQILNDTLEEKSQGKNMKWPADDGCNDYWETIAEILRNITAEMIVKWMPSHLDEPNKNKEKRQNS